MAAVVPPQTHDPYARPMAISPITTFLWFDDQALEAAEFYCSLFPDSKLGAISYYRADAQKPAGSVLVVEFELFGQPYAALNGGPEFPHSEAVSFQVRCDTQDEIDHLWDTIVDNGGQESMCGWCKDRWGVSWQIIPSMLSEVLSGADGGSADRAFAAMMQMRRLDVAALKAAAAGG